MFCFQYFILRKDLELILLIFWKKIVLYNGNWVSGAERGWLFQSTDYNYKRVLRSLEIYV